MRRAVYRTSQAGFSPSCRAARAGGTVPTALRQRNFQSPAQGLPGRRAGRHGGLRPPVPAPPLHWPRPRTRPEPSANSRSRQGPPPGQTSCPARSVPAGQGRRHRRRVRTPPGCQAKSSRTGAPVPLEPQRPETRLPCRPGNSLRSLSQGPGPVILHVLPSLERERPQQARPGTGRPSAVCGVCVTGQSRRSGRRPGRSLPAR